MAVNAGPINAPSIVSTSLGITLSEFRQRLRNQLSGYSDNTLITNNPIDRELQFINDGIGQLWPHDYQVVRRSLLTIAGKSFVQLPSDTEHVFGISTVDRDINEPSPEDFLRIPYKDGGWTFAKEYFAASTTTLEDGTTQWTDDTVRALIINDLGLFGSVYRGSSVSASSKYIVVRYARRWQPLSQDTDSIDPSPQRVQAIIHYACAQYFMSEYQVNAESIRYRNYIAMANEELKLFNMHLLRDPKTLYIL